MFFKGDTYFSNRLFVFHPNESSITFICLEDAESDVLTQMYIYDLESKELSIIFTNLFRRFFITKKVVLTEKILIYFK